MRATCQTINHQINFTLSHNLFYFFSYCFLVSKSRKPEKNLLEKKSRQLKLCYFFVVELTTRGHPMISSPPLGEQNLNRGNGY